MALTSLPWLRRDSGANSLQGRDREPGLEEAKCTVVGARGAALWPGTWEQSPQCPPLARKEAQTSPTGPWGSSAWAAWGFRASLESGGWGKPPVNPVHPREAAGLMTSHLDLSPQSDLSEVKMSAGGQGVGGPCQRRKGFKPEKSEP